MAKSPKETKGTGMHPATRYENTNEPFKKNIWLLCMHFRLKRAKGEFSCDLLPHNCSYAAYCPAYEEDTYPQTKAIREKRYKKYLDSKGQHSANKGNKTKRHNKQPSITRAGSPKPKAKPKPKPKPADLKDYLARNKGHFIMAPTCPKTKVDENKKLLHASVDNPKHGEGYIVSVSDTGTFHVLFRDGYDQDFAYNAFETGYLALKQT